MRSSFLLPLLVFATPCVQEVRANETFVFRHENVMGTSLEMQVAAKTLAEAQAAESRALSEIDRLSTILSTYDPTSELSRWLSTRDQPIKLSRELADLLRASDAWRLTSQGAFDVRVQELSQLWAISAQRQQPPGRGQLEALVHRLAIPAWRFDTHDPGVAAHTSDAPLSLNAIAKGEIVGRACAAAYGRGEQVEGVLLNVGGDIEALGSLVAQVGIADPRHDSESAQPLSFIRVQNRAVSTSGNSQRGFVIQGRRYSHIIDPRTGEPAANTIQATVVAPSVRDSDALATICNVLTPEESLRLIESIPGAACLIVTREGRLYRSAGWSMFERQDTPALKANADDPVAAPVDNGLWSPEYELAVDFEIIQPENAGRRYRRPYVVIWVEDEDGNTVQTLLLWVSLGGAGPEKWLPDLRRWYRGDNDQRDEKKNLVSTMARATRPPGKYSVTWDGKDANGKPVKRGKYTLLIDSAREHGTYQHIRSTLDIQNAPFKDELKGNIEIGRATVEFRPVPASKAVEKPASE